MVNEMNKDGDNFWIIGDIKLRTAETGDAAIFKRHYETSPAWIERAYDKIGPPPGERDAESWLSEYAGIGCGDKRVFIIERTDDGEFIGYIDVWETDSRNGVFKTGIKMLDGYSGKGFATRAFTLVLGFYFDELRYQKCDVYIYDFNEASLRFHEKLGFVREGALRREYYSNGRFFDSICLGLTVEEFREKQAQY